MPPAVVGYERLPWDGYETTQSLSPARSRFRVSSSHISTCQVAVKRDQDRTRRQGPYVCPSCLTPIFRCVLLLLQVSILVSLLIHVIQHVAARARCGAVICVLSGVHCLGHATVDSGTTSMVKLISLSSKICSSSAATNHCAYQRDSASYPVSMRLQCGCGCVSVRVSIQVHSAIGR